MNKLTHVKLATMDFLHERKLSAMEVPRNNLKLMHRLSHALLQGLDYWRLQPQEVTGVQRGHDTVFNIDYVASVVKCLLPVAACGTVADGVHGFRQHREPLAYQHSAQQDQGFVEAGQ
ncbi:hypothetical protein H257_05672 [Aphanomyces astaci]|uniref:Uncharacterized protein n=1 Tax=Aphanomyces astaci TaxID=112090 RepID=W4GN15_APHAT|nr:hypothetical protein H257_05672 [Aphanomyces astaci]ETV81047.1 hypothetical protein H257_05672 [Aphanomyces astaci]|eukprot:XP_009828905.1 hypothetical protein H257_05672 [Aphanomyces astaci]